MSSKVCIGSRLKFLCGKLWGVLFEPTFFTQKPHGVIKAVLMQRLQFRLGWCEENLPHPHQVCHGQLGQKDKAKLQDITVQLIACCFCNLSFLIRDTTQRKKKKKKKNQGKTTQLEELNPPMDETRVSWPWHY